MLRSKSVLPWLLPAAVALFGMPVFAAAPVERIVTIGGPVTEIAFALGAGSQIVAVDSSSVYPEAVAKLPQIGYQRTLSAEGVMSLKPTRIIASQEAGPAVVVGQLKSSGIAYITVPAEHSLAGAKAKIQSVAAALGRERQGDDLIARLEGQMASVLQSLQRVVVKPRVLFVYARGAGTLNIAGNNTAASEMIVLSGGVNAVTGYEGYKPLTPEALAAAAPDVILIASRGLESLGGRNGLLKVPGVALTPAGRTGRLVEMDDLLLLGFGPRLADAVGMLAAALHPSETTGP